MKERAKKLFALLMAASVGFSSFGGLAFAAEVKAAEVMPDSEKNILLIQTVSPWYTSTNETVLNSLLQQGKIAGWAKTTMEDAVGVDFSNYNMIILASDQSSDTYDSYESIRIALEGFASSGGTVLFSACDNGWAGGNFDVTLPGDAANGGSIRKTLELDTDNYIQNTNNPFVLGQFGQGSAIPSDEGYIRNNYASHTSFIEDTLPGNVDIIFRASDSDKPTLIGYPYGDGYILASGLTWEHAYEHRGDSWWGWGVTGDFSYDYYDDLICYTLSKSVSVIPDPVSVSTFVTQTAQDGDQHTVQVSATVRNVNEDLALSRAFASLELNGPGEIQGDALQVTDSLNANGDITFTWDVQFTSAQYPVDSIFSYSVSAGSNRTLTQTVNGSLKVPDWVNDKRFTENDVWTAGNFAHPDGCVLDDAQISSLISALDPTEYYALTKALETIGDTGHCLGLTGLSVMNKMGVMDVDLSDQSNALICYYQAMQSLPISAAEIQSFMAMDTEAQVGIIANAASNVKFGGTPVVIGFSKGGAGHAFVAYDVVDDASVAGYDKKVLTYDPNAGSLAEADYCFYYNSLTGQWSVPAYGATDANAELIDVITAYGVAEDGDTYTYNAELIDRSGAAAVLTANSDSWDLNAANGASGNLPAYTEMKGGSANAMHVILPSATPSYSVDQAAGEMDYAILYNDQYLAAEADNATEVFFVPKSADSAPYVELDGVNGAFALTLADDTLTDAHFTGYRLEGTANGKVTLTFTNGKVQVTMPSGTATLVATDRTVTSNTVAISDTNLAEYRRKGNQLEEVSNARNLVWVTDVTMNSAATIKEGETLSLTASVVPSNASNRNIIWSSSNEDVATVDENGRVTALASGVVRIYATSEMDDSKSAYCTVTIDPVEPDPSTLVRLTSIQLPANYTVVKGTEVELTDIVLTPGDANDMYLYWASADNGIAYAFNGTLFAKDLGSTNIWVTDLATGIMSNVCYVTVINGGNVTLTLDKNDLSLKMGEAATLTASIAEDEFKGYPLQWSSDDNTIATVDQNGRVTGLSVGRTKIVVMQPASGARAECQVTVSEDGASVSAITIYEGTYSAEAKAMLPGETTVLKALVEPEDAASSVVWTSDNASVAEIGQDGTLTAKSAGKAVISATSQDGSVKDTVRVTVFNEGQAITFDNSTDTYDANATYTAKKDDQGKLAAIFSSHSDKKVTELEIPAFIVYDGAQIAIEEIAPKAVANHKKLKEVYIGENVEEIGDGAFQGCKKLKKIEIDTVSLTSDSVSSSAFKKINKKAKFLIDDEEAYAAYKKWLRKKGCKKAKVINND